ncbi:MAG: hypothetical protein E7626_00630 [Ruminococcaceae bacterium]|nr:hypothetical protein [Oscillospiraceae bacterium]
MKKVSKILWGILLVALGVIFALNALDITNIDIFFDGWWTLFIIVPCVIGVITEHDKIGNAVGIVIGVVLLLCSRDILSFSLFWKLIVPVIIVGAGLKLLVSGIIGNKAGEMLGKMKEKGANPKVGCAVFSGCEMVCDGEVFDGAELVSVFGGVDCNLKNAIIEKDCAIRVTAVFGGVDIILPANVNVKVDSTCIFGGISNKIAPVKDAPTVYISGICIFGGADVT